MDVTAGRFLLSLRKSLEYAMTARQHHFVPQCYLKGFVEDRERPKLFTLDLRTRRSFSTPPRNVAGERDFHRIDVEGHPLDALENAFSEFETELDQALRRIVNSNSIDHPDDRAYLFNLIGLMATKNPRLRNNFGDFSERVSKQILRLMTATPERWESQVKKMKKAGYLPEETNANYETLRAFINRDEFSVETSRHTHLALELGALDRVLPYIFGRKWILFRAPPTAGFVTSDHPMSLMWSEPAQRGHGIPPGLGLLRTQLLFPVSSGLAILGTFELEKEIAIDASERQVAEINGSTILHARHQIYARGGDFPYVFAHRAGIGRGAELLQDLPYRIDKESK